MIKFILTDIEGTTTSISFVHETLFPYASKYLRQYVEAHAGVPEVKAALAKATKVLQDEGEENIDRDRVMEALLQWIKEDRKEASLKELQGMLWKHGYEQGDFKGHLYEEVPGYLHKWDQAGIRLGVYSSGSVDAQKLLFKYSGSGDLSTLFSANFDTAVGHKRERASYANISWQLNMFPQHILFLSDIEAELDAASAAGFKVIQLLRPGTSPSFKHPKAHDFGEVDKLLEKLAT